MNKKRGMAVLLILAMILAMILVLAACGSSGQEPSGGPSSSVSSAAQQDAINELAKEAAEVPEPDTGAAIQAEGSAAGNASASSVAGAADKLLGEWVDVNDASREVKITANGNEYQYTDPDGTYTGTVKDGVLTIKISDAENDTATVFIDSKSGNLVTNYQGDIYEFTRKLKQ